MEFEEGIRTDISHEDYLSIPALSSSALKIVHEKSLLHYDYSRRHPRPPTDAMAMGTALHMMILEPDRARTDVLCVPAEAPNRPTRIQLNAKKPSPATLEAIDWWRAWNERTAGKTVLSPDHYAQAEGMAEAVRNHPSFDDLFTGGSSEVSLQWTDETYGMPCKCRFDYLTRDGWATDLKSCADASPGGFARASASFLYHFQDAHYRAGFEAMQGEPLKCFLFVAVESEPPHAVGVYMMPENALNFARDRIDAIKARLREAQATNVWPGYSPNVQQLVYPKWATQLATPY